MSSWPKALRESAAEKAANHLTPAGSPPFAPPPKASPAVSAGLPCLRLENSQFSEAPPTAESPHAIQTGAPARPRLRCSGAQQGEASLEPAGGGTARMENSQERWCPLSSRVPSLVTVLLRLKTPSRPHLSPQEAGRAPEATGRDSRSAWAPGLQSLFGLPGVRCSGAHHPAP